MGQIEVRFFASVREAVGVDSIRLETPPDVSALWAGLVERYPEIAGFHAHLRFAVNQTFANETTKLKDDDVIALIPPVAGGSSMAFLTETAIDLAALRQLVAHDGAGALVSFEGVVRNHSKGRDVEYLEYEVYPEMALKVLNQILAEASEKWPGSRNAVCHRHGKLLVGDTAVFIATSSPHRVAAYEANRYIIERIKEDVPIWKREVGPDGASWVGMGS